MNAFFKVLLHAAIGGAAAGAGYQILPAIQLLHVDPGTGAVIGSVASSLLSLFAAKPELPIAK